MPNKSKPANPPVAKKSKASQAVTKVKSTKGKPTKGGMC